MFGDHDFRSWLSVLGWRDHEHNLRVGALPPSDRRLARHLGAIRSSWLEPSRGPVGDDPNSDDDWCTTDAGSDTATPTPRSFDAVAGHRILAERTATLQGLDLSVPEMDELGVLCTIAHFCIVDAVLSPLLLTLRRVDEIIAHHVHGPTHAAIMVDDRHRAALSTYTSLRHRPIRPAICQPSTSEGLRP